MPDLEFAVLANHAEALNGLLYLSGAGWTEANLPFLPGGGPSVPFHLGIGVSVLVPWTQTNRVHNLELVIENEDGVRLVEIGGELQVGRPVGIPEGIDQRAVMAFNIEVQFSAAGGYRLRAQISGMAPKTVSFRVHEAGVISPGAIPPVVEAPS